VGDEMNLPPDHLRAVIQILLQTCGPLSDAARRVQGGRFGDYMAFHTQGIRYKPEVIRNSNTGEPKLTEAEEAMDQDDSESTGRVAFCDVPCRLLK